MVELLDGYRYRLSGLVRSGYRLGIVDLPQAASPPTLSGAVLTLPDAQVGQAFPATDASVLFTGPAVYSASGLAPGLRISRDTGIITGTPSMAGTYTLTFTATNSEGSVTTGEYTIVVAIAAPTYDGSLDGVTVNLTEGVAMTPVDIASAFTGEALTISIETGALPPGLTFDGSIISGTPDDI